jgi:hypothetical protein
MSKYCKGARRWRADDLWTRCCSGVTASGAILLVLSGELHRPRVDDNVTASWPVRRVLVPTVRALLATGVTTREAVERALCRKDGL